VTGARATKKKERERESNPAKREMGEIIQKCSGAFSELFEWHQVRHAKQGGSWMAAHPLKLLSEVNGGLPGDRRNRVSSAKNPITVPDIIETETVINIERKLSDIQKPTFLRIPINLDQNSFGDKEIYRIHRATLSQVQVGSAHPLLASILINNTGTREDRIPSINRPMGITNHLAPGENFSESYYQTRAAFFLNQFQDPGSLVLEAPSVTSREDSWIKDARKDILRVINSQQLLSAVSVGGKDHATFSYQEPTSISVEMGTIEKVEACPILVAYLTKAKAHTHIRKPEDRPSQYSSSSAMALSSLGSPPPTAEPSQFSSIARSSTTQKMAIVSSYYLATLVLILRALEQDEMGDTLSFPDQKLVLELRRPDGSGIGQPSPLATLAELTHLKISALLRISLIPLSN
jgi:hypothetical protein